MNETYLTDFARAADKYADKHALEDADGFMTYRELADLSGRVAAKLASEGVGRGQIVTIRMPRSARSVAAMIGVLKAGAAMCYMSMDYPEERVAFMKKDTASPLTVDAAWMEDLPSAPAPEVGLSGEDPAIVVYTSGSTGSPKGVVNPHKALHMAVRAGGLRRTDQDRCLAMASFAFIAVVPTVLMPLTIGCTVCIAPEEICKDADQIAAYINEKEVTFSFIPPQMARYVLPRVEDQLRILMVGSEKVRGLYSPKVMTFNTYGASETCCICTSFLIDRMYPGTVPIGRPLEGTQILLLDDDGAKVPDGEIGEICVAGQIATGYLNLPEATAERFVPNPFPASDADTVMYRTGDLGRWNAEGELEYVQRKDWMVKIRGYRVEPGEVEAAMRAVEGVQEAVVKDFENARGEVSLFGVYTSEDGVEPEAIRERIQAVLPPYMVPAFLQRLEKMPLNANGKLDRKSIAPPDVARFRASYEAPQDEDEKRIVEAFSRVLGVDGVSVLDDFSLLGGDSLAAAALQAELAGMDLSAADILSKGTPRALAHIAREVPITKAAPRDAWPLTYAEQRMATEQGLDPESVSHNINFEAFRIRGDFDVERMQKAVDALAARHDILRSCYPMEHGEYVHRVMDELHVPIRTFQCAPEEVADRIRELDEPFDLSKAPLWRVDVFEHGDQDRTLHFDIHHIIMDGTSWQVFQDDLFSLYSGRELPPLPLQFQDHAVWQDEHDNLAKGEQAFLAMYADGVPDNEMPSRNGRPEHMPFADTDIERSLDRARLGEVARRFGATRYELLMALAGMTLAKYTGTDDVVIGSAMSGRTRVEQAGMIGMFVNVLPVRLRPKADMPFSEYVIRTVQAIREVKDNQTYPFERIAAQVAPDRTAASAPVYDMILNYLQEVPAPEIEGAEVSIPRFKRQALDLDFMLEAVVEGDEVRFILSYSPEMYDEEVPSNFMEQMLATLSRMEKADGSETVGELADLPEDQKRQILVDFAGPRTPLPEGTIVDMFRAQARKRPDHKAVVADGRSMTYGELDRITEAFAAELAQKGVGKGSVAGIMVHRGFMMPVGALSVLKTGAAYLPMDPAYPAERLSFMAQDAGVRTIVADADLMDRMPDFDGEWVDSGRAFAAPDAAQVPPGPSPEDLFILLYTSGTTGNPKGVMLRHSNLANFVPYYIRARDLKAGDSLPAYASFGFDACMMDMYPTLASGATLHIIPEEMRLDLPALRQYFADNNISVAFMTTQLGRQFAEEGKTSGLRALSVGGETLTPLEPPEGFTLYNVYGPTECTIYVTQATVDRLYERVPIGKPVDNTAAYIVDYAGRLAPVGVAGELGLAGRSVASGYLNRPDLTEEKFAPNPFSDDPEYSRMYKTGDVVRFLPSGQLDFVGRRDFQVKIRGFRVELTEIEGRIREFEGIRDATVQAVDDAAGGKRIVAYVVADDPVDIQAMNAFIAETLPVYMVPAATMQLDRIPLNPNGKVDKRRLPKITVQAEEVVPPRNEAEQAIFDVVARVLGSDAIGVTTDLMYAGLNSLSAIKAASLITERTGRRVRTVDILEGKTIENVARRLEQSDEYVEESFEKLEAYPLTHNQLGLYFALVKDPGTLVYNIPFELSFTDAVDPERLASAARAVVDAHPYLKTHFAMRDNEPVQLRQDDAPVDVPVIQVTDEEFEHEKASFVRPFSFFEGPLFRLAVYKVPDSVHLLGDFHHMIFDGGSLDIFLGDLAAAYGGQELEGERFTSFDLALQQKRRAEGGEEERARAFYEKLIGDREGATRIPPDNERPQAGTPRYVRSRIRKTELTDAVRGLGVTPSNLFLAATGLVTGRFAGTHDVRIAAITNGRDGAQVQRNMGMLVETLPMVLAPEPDRTAGDYLRDTQQRMLDTLANRAYPYLKASSDFGYDAQVMYAFQGGVVGGHAIGGEAARPETLGLDRAKFPVSLNIQEDDDFYIVEAEYDDSVFSEHLMQAYADCVADAARLLGADPDARLGTLSVLTDAQRRQIDSFNKPVEPVAGANLFRVFEAQAASTPDAPALHASGEDYTYRELNEKANRLANALISKGVRKGDRVAFMLPRDARVILSMLGIMKSGAAYIPVDPEYPEERIRHILEDSGARFILTDGPSAQERSLDVNGLLQDPDTANPDVPVRQDDLCYIIYTSGSTGKPKGVMISHGNIMNYVVPVEENVPAHAVWANKCSMVSVTTVSFDMFLKEAFTTLMNGQRLILANDEEAKNPDQLAELFRRTGGNAFNATPSRVLQYMALPGMRDALAGCRVIMAGGEAYPPMLFQKLRGVSDAILINTYGPTETTVSCNGKILEGPDITIGHPLHGVREQVMDIDGQPLPAGVTGELWISGNGVAPGYFGNPEMTAQQFVERDGRRFYKSGDLARWTDEGDIQILGRNDGQIKLRGLRIELGEIERVIAAQKDITGCVVLVRKLHGTEQLCAYYTASAEIDPERLREEISAQLTRYMVPAAYLQLDEMPMTPNGKIDRKNLPEARLLRRDEYVEPQEGAEKAYADIFADILGIERVGATDSFFDLGGTSLLVTQVTIDAAKQDMHISYADVFANPTPRELAALAEGAAAQTEAADEDITAYDYGPIHNLLSRNTIEALRDGEPQELGNVCITGATGFLGIHVLREFLRSEKGAAYCVVRSSGKIPASERLKNMLVYYFSDSFDDLFGSRIIVVDGDVTDPAVFERMEKYPIDTVINCAANVKHFSAGTDIEDVNVGGVENAIAFCEKKGCRFIQVSTASVAGMSVDGVPEEDTVLDETSLYFGQDLSNKYTHSKFLAERLALEAALRGLPVKIMRVGNLMARSEDGEFQANFKTNNFLGRLRAYHIIGKVPYGDLGMNAEFAPIDSTARAILALARTPEENRVFHPYNDHSIYIGDVIASLRSMGIEIKPVEECEYEKAYSEAMLDKEKARHLNSLIAYQEYGRRVLPIRSSNRHTSQALARQGFLWPITDRTYLENFFDLMLGLGFFDDEN